MNDELVEEHYPALAARYHDLPRPIMRVDMVRCMYLHRFGGVYADLDYRFFRPFDLLEHDLVLPSETALCDGIRIGNSIMASRPGHPFWELVFESFLASDLQDADEDGVLHGTGPFFLTSVLERYPDRHQVCVPDRPMFHPPATALRSRVRWGNRSCGVHLCDGSWRSSVHWTQRVSNRLARLRA
jgi:mannosyltransferase OCH1-like enzyme